MPKKVALVGGRGYLGRGLERALSEYFEVVVFDLPTDLSEIVDQKLLLKDFTIVANLATLANRTMSRVSQFSDTWRVNIFELERLADQLNEHSIPFIHFSTREVFGMPFNRDNTFEVNGVRRPSFLVHEDFPKNPNNEYAMHKLLSEWLLHRRPETWVLRLSTPYTEEIGQFGSLIPSIVDKAMNSLPIKLGSFGKQFRDPLHVKDLASAIKVIEEKRPDFGTINLGYPEANLISLVEIVEYFSIHDIEFVPGDDYGFAFAIDLMRSIGWEPKITIRDFLRQVSGR